MLPFSKQNHIPGEVDYMGYYAWLLNSIPAVCQDGILVLSSIVVVLLLSSSRAKYIDRRRTEKEQEREREKEEKIKSLQDQIKLRLDEIQSLKQANDQLQMKIWNREGVEIFILYKEDNDMRGPLGVYDTMEKALLALRNTFTEHAVNIKEHLGGEVIIKRSGLSSIVFEYPPPDVIKVEYNIFITKFK